MFKNQLNKLWYKSLFVNNNHWNGFLRVSQRSFTYKPKIQMVFDNNDEFHIYHYERGENTIKMLSRINVVFLWGNTLLLAFELSSPFFGWWHAMSLLIGILYLKFI